MNYERFYAYNKQLLNSGLVRRATIEEVSLKNETVVLFNISYAIKTVISEVEKQRYCLTNASLLKNWKGFKPEDDEDYTFEKVQNEKAPYAVVVHEKDGTMTQDNFDSKNEALKEFELYIKINKKLDSTVLKNVALLNLGKNEVDRIIYIDPKTSKIALDLTTDDIVRYRKEWCREEERKYIFSVHNINDNSNTCVINCLNTNLTLGSSETVGLEMIEKTGKTLTELKKEAEDKFILQQDKALTRAIKKILNNYPNVHNSDVKRILWNDPSYYKGNLSGREAEIDKILKILWGVGY